MDYKSAGVDIEKANNFIDKIKENIKKTFRPEVISEIGGFGGLFDLRTEQWHNPILVSSVDGVGTKLKLALLTGIHNTIGKDLVAMVLNDIVVSGAEPLFFLDYFATGQLDEDIAEKVLEGIIEGCKEANCALIGGETAEMPGMYNKGEYDLAGFGVGIVNKDNIIDGSNISKGNKIIGLKSSGAHSNGYSLIRKIFIEKKLFDINKFIESEDRKLIEILMEPTTIYVSPILKLIKNFQVNGMAHITGGGFIDNIPRILPERTKAIIDISTWEIPFLFKLIKNIGNISEIEMFKTFNNGIGFILIVPEKSCDEIIDFLNNFNLSPIVIGEIAERKDTNESKIELKNLDNVFDNITI